jgi:hypothetical protein
MSGKEIAGTGDGKRYVEWLASVFHVATRAFQDCKCGVTFIEMANLGVQSQGSQKPPTSYTKN